MPAHREGDRTGGSSVFSFGRLRSVCWILVALASAACGKLPFGSKPTDQGAPAPGWKLRDFQPQSPRYREIYGLEQFRGSVVLLALYAGTCDVCIVLTRELDRLDKQWQAEGLGVKIAVINAKDAATNQRDLVEVADFPLFQDTQQVDAFAQQGGGTDDLYVYTPGGRLSRYFRWADSVTVQPITRQGQNNLRAAVVKAGR
ncbi:MAG: redoxin domain-containing protein [Polyangiaceae bacterium]|nr:redoxin domain-containing protein [Polyangiaceae bacterium]